MNRMNRDLPAAGRRATWLVVFPPALGDSILSFPIVDRVRAADPGIEVVIAALPHLQAFLKDVEGLAEVLTYDDLAGECGGRHLEWVIDLSGFEHHKKLGEKRNFDNAIYRTFAQWDRIVVRSPSGERDVPDPIFARSSSAFTIGGHTNFIVKPTRIRNTIICTISVALMLTFLPL